MIILRLYVTKDSADFYKLIKEQNVTVLNQTPSCFYSLTDFANIKDRYDSFLRYIIFGGEKLKPELLKFWYELYPRTKLINMYGITETTVHVTFT